MKSARSAVCACCLLGLSSPVLAQPSADSVARSLPPAGPPLVESSRDVISPARPTFFETVRADMRSLASTRTLGILATGAVIAAASGAVESPEPAARALGTGPWEGPSHMGNRYGSQLTLGAGALALMAVGRLSDRSELTELGSRSARSLLYTAALVTAVKVAADRTRPNGDQYSFPSGHTAAAFAVAPVIARQYGPRGAIPAYALAVATGMGRIEDRKHFLSDVTFGAAIGLSVGLAVSNPRYKGPEFSVTPSGAAITVRF